MLRLPPIRQRTRRHLRIKRIPRVSLTELAVAAAAAAAAAPPVSVPSIENEKNAGLAPDKQEEDSAAFLISTHDSVVVEAWAEGGGTAASRARRATAVEVVIAAPNERLVCLPCASIVLACALTCDCLLKWSRL